MEKEVMVPPKKERKLFVFCRLCKKYDIPVGKQISHLKKEHNVPVDSHSDIAPIREFIFLKVNQ